MLKRIEVDGGIISTALSTRNPPFLAFAALHTIFSIR